MLFSVEQAFVGREEIRSPLKRLRGRLASDKLAVDPLGVESYFGQREKECLARFPI